MRALLLTAAAALALAGCDQLQHPFAKKAAAPAAAPVSAPAAQSAAAPPAQPAATPDAQAAAQPAIAPAPAAPPAAQVVRWSPADYAKRERRLDALIANAETRDTTGETQRRAEEGRARRARCTSRGCIEASYAAEEAWLKQWESSGG